jgi:hypothetical protein
VEIRLTNDETSGYARHGPQEAAMFRPQAVLALVLVFSLSLLPLYGSPAPAPVIGTVTSATSARVGATTASVGSTVFGGDFISTEKFGSIQVRAGAARLLLSGASAAALGQRDGIPSATLASGTAVFSTANAKAFVLHAATADIRPKADVPTVGQVTYVSDKELRVRSTRGALAITVDGETQFIPDGTAYRVILDPDAYYAANPAAAQGPEGSGTKGHKEPRRAGRSRFLLIAISVISVATGIALYEAWVSPDGSHGP